MEKLNTERQQTDYAYYNVVLKKLTEGPNASALVSIFLLCKFNLFHTHSVGENSFFEMFSPSKQYIGIAIINPRVGNSLHPLAVQSIKKIELHFSLPSNIRYTKSAIDQFFGVTGVQRSLTFPHSSTSSEQSTFYRIYFYNIVDLKITASFDQENFLSSLVLSAESSN